MNKTICAFVFTMFCVFSVPAQAGIIKKALVVGGMVAAGKAAAKHQEKKKLQKEQRG